MNPRCSILMRTKNVAWVLDRTLAGLASQTITDRELIIVDSGSTDTTLAIAADYPHRRIDIAPEDYFPGKVLNRAAAEARGEILVLWNSDAVPLRADALERLLAAFDDPAVEAAYARQLPRPEAEQWVRRDYAKSFPAEGPAAPWIGLSFPLAAVRAEAWRRHPFYTAAWGSEDTEWGVSARRRGASVAYVRDALVMHSHDYTLAQGWGRRFIEGEADSFIHPDRAVSVPRVLGRAVRDAAVDFVDAARVGRANEMLRGVARRGVDAVAYLRGHRHGTRRRLHGRGDPKRGQRAVLSTHESTQTQADRAALRGAP